MLQELAEIGYVLFKLLKVLHFNNHKKPKVKFISFIIQ